MSVEHASASSTTKSTRTRGVEHRFGLHGLDVDAGSIHGPHHPVAVLPGEHRHDRHAAAPAQRPRRSPGTQRSSPWHRRGSPQPGASPCGRPRARRRGARRRAPTRVWPADGRTATTAARTSGCARRGCDTAARARSEPARARSGPRPSRRRRSPGRCPRSSPRGEAAPLDARPHLVGPPSVAAAMARALLPSHSVAKDPPADLVLTPLGAEARPLSEWLTTFHLATVALDPYTNESAWILPTATRILDGLRGSDARVNLLVTAPEDDARAFLGPLVKQFLVFVDDDRSVVKALGLETLPAFVFIRVDTTVPAAAEGWRPAEWRAVAETVADHDGVAVAGHPRRRRPRPVPRARRPWRRCSSPTSRSATGSSMSTGRLPIIDGRWCRRRPAPARRPSSRSPCSTRRGSVTAGSSCSSRDASRRGRQPGGWPRSPASVWVTWSGTRPGTNGHRTSNPCRGAHRGCADPTAAERPRVARRRLP